MCLLHVPISNFSPERSVWEGTKYMPSLLSFFFLPFCGTIENLSRIERGSLPPCLFLPGRLKCRVSYAEEKVLRVWGASGCAWSNDVVAVWHVRHAFTALWQSWIELERLSRHERRRDRQRKRMREIQREGGQGFQLTVEFSLPL